MPAVSLEFAVAGFVMAAIVIAAAGIRMADIADRLADRTGLGEAVVGGLLLGMSTSLSGLVTSITAAVDGSVSLAVSNAVGGIAAQTVFLVVADIVYREINLEHAAADEKHMLQAAVLLLMLSLPLVAYLAPAYAIWGIHPVTMIMVGLYAFGANAAFRLQRNPMWQPSVTPYTAKDEPAAEAQKESLQALSLTFAGLAVILALAGFVIARTGIQIASEFGISQTVVGALLTAVATSLPELVTTIAAVRQGALQLAVGGIVGGNVFDVLFLAVSDAFYRDGPLYTAMAQRDALMIISAILITGVLLLGLIMRDRRGIGIEGYAILIVYASVVALQIGLG